MKDRHNIVIASVGVDIKDVNPSLAMTGKESPFGLLAMTNSISRFDAEMLLAHLLGVSRAGLYIYGDEIKPDVVDKFNAFVEKRAAGRPIQYILGTAEFMGLEFIVNPDVLIPRPETELLVEEAIRIVGARFIAPLISLRCQGFDKSNPYNESRNDVFILDLCTGCGNIAIALTKFMPDCKIIISDVSNRALAVARVNAKRNLVDKRIDFVLSDLFEKLPKMKFDMIVSNPPYVASHEIDLLSCEITFEPRIALDGGPDGLDVYRRIINGASLFLKANGYLLLEMGAGQDEEIKGLLISGGFDNIRFIDDYNKIKRIAAAQWTG